MQRFLDYLRNLCNCATNVQPVQHGISKYCNLLIVPPWRRDHQEEGQILGGGDFWPVLSPWLCLWSHSWRPSTEVRCRGAKNGIFPSGVAIYPQGVFSLLNLTLDPIQPQEMPIFSPCLSPGFWALHVSETWVGVAEIFWGSFQTGRHFLISGKERGRGKLLTGGDHQPRKSYSRGDKSWSQSSP